MGNKYENELLDAASKLDAVAGAQGEIMKYALEIVEHQDETATIKLLNKISDVVDLNEGIREVKLLAKAVKDYLIQFYGYVTIRDMYEQKDVEEDTRTLPELLANLNELIGLHNVKEKVNELIAFQKVQQLRKKEGFPSTH